MSGKNTTVSLTLQIKGNAGQELRRISNQQIQATNRINTQWTQIGSAQTRFVNTSRAGTQATLNTARAGEQLLRTNRMLEGVLRQQAIQTRLQSQALRQQVASTQQMANLMRQIEQSSRRTQESTRQTQQNTRQTQQAGNGWMSAVGSVALGGMAGVSVLQRPVRDTMQYEKELAQLSITAYDNPQDRKQGQDTLRAIITGAAKEYGQTNDDAMTGLASLIASGKFKGSTNQETENNLRKALNDSALAAQASGGNITDFAQMSVQAIGKKLDTQKFMSLAVQAGKEGNFETRDLAKFIPMQFGMLASDPANQLKQAAQLMALNQVAMSTAGSPDMAGNNVKGLLSKMSAESTKKALKDDFKIDLDQEYLRGTEKGKTKFEIFYDVLSRASKQDKEFQKIVNEVKKANTSAERASILESNMNYLQQSSIQKILPDMEAMSAGIAMVTQWDELQRISDANERLGLQSMDEDSATMRDTASYGVNKLSVTRKNSEFEAMGSFTDAIGDTSEKLSEYADQYPGLATAIAGTTVAMTTLAAATGGAALGGVLGGGGIASRVGGAVAGARAAVTGPAGWAVGLGLGTYAGTSALLNTDTGQKFQNQLSEKTSLGKDIAEVLAFFGNDEAQAALEAQAKYDEMIAQQQQANQLSADMIGKLNSLITVTSLNKPIPMQFPKFPTAASLLDGISNKTATEEQRYGAPPSYSFLK